MDGFVLELKQKGFKGEIASDLQTLEQYSHDASMFEILPELVVSPLDTNDVCILVNVITKEKKHNAKLSLTARSAGTDMSGGAINDSIIVDFMRHINSIEEVTDKYTRVQPGTFYRDLEKATLKKNALMPFSPASRELCAVGGIVNNNSGGELSLRYGKAEDYVNELDVVLSDGQSYKLKPLNEQELKQKMAGNTFEAKVYKQIYNLIDKNYDLIKNAKPKVTKNSTGYNLWDIWDRQTGIFDLTKLFVGGQGTLGFVTEVNFRLIKVLPYGGVLVLFLKNIDNLGEIINAILPHKPASLESFDNYTLWFSIKFLPYFRKTIGWKGVIKLVASLIPDALVFFKGIPKMVVLIEFIGQTQDEVDRQILSMQADLKSKFKLEGVEDDNTLKKAWKFRIMRRESFNLLRKKVKDKHTAPFIDDLVVPPPRLVEFLPQLRAILKKYKLLATIAGHLGDGNFHVIPLMKFELESERQKIEPVMKEVNELVLSYGGSLSGEHNDGLIRGPWLERSYGKEVYDLFVATKKIFDPEDIFNPHKKTDANWEYTAGKIRQHF
ncbi:MAG TPA: FAD-binding oxidoreductase [Candidatus Saccharimonadia bacterium]|nr:FAD-binding oxidoreductase [Candidatus Saccharimonadia bacterium]